MGELKNGQKHGYGVLIRPCGSKFEGHFKNGVAEGEGKFFHPSGATLHACSAVITAVIYLLYLTTSNSYELRIHICTCILFRACRGIPQVISMKASGRTTRHMGRENSHMQTDLLMKV